MIIKEKVKKQTPTINPNNIHGHVCIDLHNHNSGFTERVEVDNLVTNAIERVYNVFTTVYSGEQLEALFPLATRGFGGLMLFDNNITENVNNIELPSNAHLIAFAGQTTDGERTYMGSYNSIESEWLSNGHKAVWDFSTAQANGTIAALSRTNYKISNFMDIIGYTSDVTEHLVGIYPKNPIYVSPTTRRLYVYCENGRVQKTKSSLEINNFDLKYNNTKAKSMDFSEGVGTLTPTVASYHGDGSGNAYGFNQGTRTLYKLEIDDDNTTVTQTELGTVNIPNTSQQLDIQSDTSLYHKGYMYICTQSFVIYKVNVNNLSDITAIDLTANLSEFGETAYPLLLRQVADGIILVSDGYLTGGQKYTLLLYDDGHIFVTNKTARATISSNNSGSMYLMPCNEYTVATSSSTIYPGMLVRPNYIGTIANIEPVTKTAAQSMKITYTLTNE